VNFVNTTIGSEDLHLRTSAPLSAAQDAGFDLSCFLRRDIDGLVRLTPWEIGADDVNLATAVTLQSFSASGAQGAVDHVRRYVGLPRRLGPTAYDPRSGPPIRVPEQVVGSRR